MIWVFLTTFVVMATVMAIMAVGVMAGREPIKGSCGGIGAIGIDQSCEICGGNPQRCEDETRDAGTAPRRDAAKAAFYDADNT
ncbi:MAG: (Na+)-NQR maturation NqrM [Chromatocurvus sp.]